MAEPSKSNRNGCLKATPDQIFVFVILPDSGVLKEVGLKCDGKIP